MQLGSGVAVALVQARSCSFNLTPSLGISICRGCGPKKQKKKKKFYQDTFSGSSLVAQWLGIRHCQCCGSGHCGVSLICGPGNFPCHRCGKKKKKRRYVLYTIKYTLLKWIQVSDFSVFVIASPSLQCNFGENPYLLAVTPHFLLPPLLPNNL